MVSSPASYPKRTCAVSLLQHTKNPILLAKKMLERSVDDLDGSTIGAQGHGFLSGPTAEGLAERWGLEMVPTEYFWTRKRWNEHERGLREGHKAGVYGRAREGLEGDFRTWKEKTASADAAAELEAQGEWDGELYLPQGTVGCVCMDRDGTLCVATSTGGLTNKLDGRIGDTPTVGAGYWANEWTELQRKPAPESWPWTNYPIFHEASDLIGACLPTRSRRSEALLPPANEKERKGQKRAVAMSGTGNGDSFLRLAACHAAGAIAQHSPRKSLATAVREVAGPGGQLQRSAMDRWGKTGEGEGGIIGIERTDEGKVVWDFNCGGMFRCWRDDAGRHRVMVFRGEYPGLDRLDPR